MFPVVTQGSSLCRPDLASSGKKSCRNGKFHLYFIVLEIIRYEEVQNNETSILDLL